MLYFLLNLEEQSPDGVTFGWSSISKMFERECERVNSGSTRMVPKLNVTCDAWTKLNVTPAKIMQVK